MNDYNLLLRKFWAGNATGAEKLQLYKLMMEQEAKMQAAPHQSLYTEEETAAMLAPEESERILQALHKEMDAAAVPPATAPRLKVWKLVSSVAAAAAIIVAVWVNRHVLLPATPSQTEKTVSSLVKTITNHQQQLMTVLLDDSSLVRIYPESSISYNHAFATGSERVVQLTGKADFKVRHRASQPFQVIARQIKTTDIGTEFCMDAQQPALVTVKLKEGIVKVEALQGSHLSLNKLLQHAGEQVSINLTTHEVTMTAPAGAAASTSIAGHTINTLKARLRFNKTPLAEVFEKLASQQQTRIRFDKTAVEGLTFTGTIEPGDALELSLDILCSLNGLTYTKTEHGIAITKSK